MTTVVSIAFESTDSADALLRDTDNARVIEILNAGLGRPLKYAFVMHAGVSIPDIKVQWSTDSDMVQAFGFSYNKLSAASLEATFPCEVYLNIENWRSLRAHQAHWRLMGIKKYREYQVTHEFGHALGVGHLAPRGRVCNVMTQQTMKPTCAINSRPTSVDLDYFIKARARGGFARVRQSKL
tara:strand:+ start:3586 stop:4131 length:546 start_codon:yes stop_codon:yes gene_type:complete